jgi:transposase
VRRAAPIVLSPAERAGLDGWVAARSRGDRLAVRAQVILQAADGATNGEISRKLGVHPETVTRWRQRFVMNRLEGLRRDAPRSGARARVPNELVDRIVRMTQGESPPSGSRWTTRSLARALQINHMLVYRVWRSHGLVPLSEPVGNRAPVVPGVWVDVMGIYLGDPAAAIVFGVGHRRRVVEEPPAHARIDPDISGAYLLPDHHSAPGAIANLLSNVEEGLPRLANVRRSPHELLVFLRGLEEIAGPATELHVVFDRPVDFVSGRLASWLRNHPRFHVRSAASNGSWGAAVDDWFRAYREVPLHRDSFQGIASLSDSLRQDSGPANRRRFAWTLPSGLEVGPITTRPEAAPSRTGAHSSTPSLHPARSPNGGSKND